MGTELNKLFLFPSKHNNFDIFSVASNFGFSSGAPSQQAGTGAAPPNYRYNSDALLFVLEYETKKLKMSITNITMKLFTLFF